MDDLFLGLARAGQSNPARSRALIDGAGEGGVAFGRAFHHVIVGAPPETTADQPQVLPALLAQGSPLTGTGVHPAAIRAHGAMIATLSLDLIETTDGSQIPLAGFHADADLVAAPSEVDIATSRELDLAGLDGPVTDLPIAPVEPDESTQTTELSVLGATPGDPIIQTPIVSAIFTAGPEEAMLPRGIDFKAPDTGQGQPLGLPGAGAPVAAPDPVADAMRAIGGSPLHSPAGMGPGSLAESGRTRLPESQRPATLRGGILSAAPSPAPSPAAPLAGTRHAQATQTQPTAQVIPGLALPGATGASAPAPATLVPANGAPDNTMANSPLLMSTPVAIAATDAAQPRGAVSGIGQGLAPDQSLRPTPRPATATLPNADPADPLPDAPPDPEPLSTSQPRDTGRLHAVAAPEGPPLRTGSWTPVAPGIPGLSMPSPADSATVTALAGAAELAARSPGGPDLGPDLGLAQGILASGSTAPGAALIAHAPSSMANAAAQQIAAALSDPARDRGAPLELALDPPELGRVRLQITELAGVMTLTIHAERPETADLMRRHLDLLAQEFAESGLDAPSVRISQEGAGNGGGSSDDREGTPQTNRAVPEAETAQSIPNHARNGGLDLRL